MKQLTLGDNGNHVTIRGIAADRIRKPQQIKRPLKRKFRDLLPVNAQNTGKKSRNKVEHIVIAYAVRQIEQKELQPIKTPGKETRSDRNHINSFFL